MAGPPTGHELGVRSPRLAAARRLAKRTARQHARAFLVEGPQAVAEAHRCAAPLTQLFVTAAARSRHGDLVSAIAAAGVPVHVVSGEVMSGLAQTVTPQGLVAVCRFVDVPLHRAIGPRGADRAPAGVRREQRSDGPAEPPRLVAVLANVRDPGNAGMVLRTADAAGAGAVIFCDASVDVYNGKCVRASTGSLFHLPVVVGVTLDDVTRALRAAGIRILAADGRARRSLDELGPRELAAPTAWLFGNEAWGLPPTLLAAADDSVAVPIYGRAESLNLAAAAAVCIYSSARAQRGVP